MAMVSVRERRYLRWLGLAGLIGHAACGGGKDEIVTAASLEVVTSTDGQSAPAGGPLPSALAVIARAANGDAVPRARVQWEVTEGSGATLTDTATVADGHGRAEVALTLGPGEGTYRVRARPADAPSAAVVLTALATAPPRLTSVTPGTFSAGDTLTLAGSGLGAGAEVDIGGAPALVVGGSATQLTVVTPPCLVPGTVEIRARVAGSLSNALSGAFASSLAPVVLTVGEYASIDPARLAGCATFPPAGADTVEYLIAPQSGAGTPGLSAQFVLAGDSVVVATVQVGPETPKLTPLPFAEQFHDALRRQEAEAAKLPRPPLEAALAAAETPGVTAGDTLRFKVCNTLPCSSIGDFDTVTARAEYVGEHAALFIDVAAPEGGFTSTDLQPLGALFDEDLYSVATTAFGSESDVDRNGVTIILFSPAVNQLTPKTQCGTSVITGYFFGVDIDPAFQNDKRSNRGEVFYAIAPDPAGTAGCSLGKDLVSRLVPVTFIHEFQHMISYHQHVLVRDGDSELLWLNEALSHVAEELAGLYFEAQGRDTLFSRFAIGSLYNASLFLDHPGQVFVLPSLGTGTLDERGASWLFLRWLLDQYGPGVSRRLVESSVVGSQNIVSAVGVPFDRLLAQWFLANWVSDLPGFTAPERLTFSTWRFRTTYASLHDQLESRFPKPFPLTPAIVSPSVAQLSGTLRAGSGQYLRLRQAPGEIGFTLRMSGPGDAPLPTDVVPRLNVIRVR